MILRLWDGESGAGLGGPFTGHKQWVSCLVWQPYHIDPECRHFASSSKVPFPIIPTRQ